MGAPPLHLVTEGLKQITFLNTAGALGHSTVTSPAFRQQQHPPSSR